MDDQIKQSFVALRRQYIDNCFTRLNDRQQEAVFYGNGPLLLLAGAGSGKTTVLVNRIANLIRFGDARYSDEVFGSPTAQDIAQLRRLIDQPDNQPDARMEGLLRVGGIAPYHILAITFTNKAAGELKSRLSAMLGQTGQDVFASTFHSACVRILRRSGEALGYPSGFTIYDSDDVQRIMKKIYKELSVDDKFMPLKQAINSISHYKDQMISPSEAAKLCGGDAKARLLVKLYTVYEELLKKTGGMDFDDLIYQTVRLFEQFPDILEQYRRKFQYILVDEYQDTSHAQFRLVELLGAGHRNICVVGDDDQSIYRFRGATIENILNFEHQFGEAKVIRLEQNYRSTANILNAANSVIEHNRGRKGKTLWTDSEKGTPVLHFVAENEQDEAKHVAASIAEHVAAGARLRDHAILYRMNALSAPVENYFVRAGLPYKVIGGHKFYDRKEIKDMLAYLHILSNPMDDLRLERIINEPGRKIGGATLETVAMLAADEGCSWLQIISRVQQYPVLSRASKSLLNFWQLYQKLQEVRRQIPLEELPEQVLELTGYRAMLKAEGEEGEARLENIGQLITAVKKYALERGEDASLEGYLEEVSLITDLDSYDENADLVVMMTLHAAKGLEYPYIYIVGMEEGVFPGQMSSFSAEDMEEERRLCYVGITRAQKELQLCSTESRMMYGQTRRNRPSRFLEEIAPECLNEEYSETAQEMHSLRNRWGDEDDYGTDRAFGCGNGPKRGMYQGKPEYTNNNKTGGDGYSSPYHGGGLRMAAGNSTMQNSVNKPEKTERPTESGEFSIRSAYERANRRSDGFDPSVSFGGVTPKKEPVKAAGEKKFEVGDTVHHKIFGTGTVVSVTPVAGDMLVEVEFAAATKKMMANYAPLTKD